MENDRHRIPQDCLCMHLLFLHAFWDRFSKFTESHTYVLIKKKVCLNLINIFNFLSLKRLLFFLDQSISFALLLVCQNIHTNQTPVFCPFSYSNLDIVLRITWVVDWNSLWCSQAALYLLYIKSFLLFFDSNYIIMIEKFQELVHYPYINSLCLIWFVQYPTALLN